jgi:hypothetical protein
MMGFGLAYCTQQTGGLTRGITLRAIHAASPDSLSQTGAVTVDNSTPNIACNTLPCSFTRMGLLPHRPELSHQEWRAMQARPRLGEQDRRPHLNAEQNCVRL